MKKNMTLFENGRSTFATILLWVVGSALIFQFGPSAQIMAWPDGIFLDVESGFSNEDAAAALKNMGANGLALYAQHFWTDLLFIILQSVGIGALLWYATGKFRGAARALRWLIVPVVCFGLLDLAENLAIRSALQAFPDIGAQQFENVRRLVALKLRAIVIIPATVVPCLGLLLAAVVRRWRHSPDQGESPSRG